MDNPKQDSSDIVETVEDKVEIVSDPKSAINISTDDGDIKGNQSTVKREEILQERLKIFQKKR